MVTALTRIRQCLRRVAPCTVRRMARKRRGWGGEPPADDEEATRRIVAAAVELLSSTGTAITIADVAESLGVIRQTVYRYFPTADDLMRAAAIASVAGFLDQLSAHVRGIHDPADAMTEGVLYTLDSVTRSPHLGILMSAPYVGAHSSDMASAEAQDFGLLFDQVGQHDLLGIAGLGRAAIVRDDDAVLREAVFVQRGIIFAQGFIILHI